MQRREFIKTSLSAAAAFFASGADAASPSGLPTRPLGRTGHRSSLVALGGIVVAGESQQYANRIVDHALRNGVNHVDVAPTYGDAEIKLGEALKGRRDKVFLACKTAQRTREGAEKELRASLERLQTDYFDLYQFHGLDNLQDLEVAFGPGGALEAMLAAREKGLIRHIGMTGHNPDNFLAALKRFPLETCMFPINFVLSHHGDYGKRLLDELVKREIGTIAIKPIAARPWQEGEFRRWPKCWYKPLDDVHQIDLAVRWALELPITTLIPSGHPQLFDKALRAARRARPLTTEERTELSTLAAALTPLFHA